MAERTAGMGNEKGGAAAGAAVGADFRNEDGILVCGVCGQPKEMRLPLPFDEGRRHVVPVLCDCERRREREREDRKEREALAERAERLRHECFPNSGFYRTCTFQRDDGRNPSQSSACQRYAATFARQDPNGLLLWGDAGTGKSFMSSCIANAVIDLGFSAVQTDIGYIVSTMESSFEDRRRNLDRILGTDLLLIDDLGAQRCTEYMMDHVFAVIDGRYRNGKPMVITTNFTLGRISHAKSEDPWYRVFDRILERCFPLKFEGTNRRRENGLEMRKAMRRRLGIE